VIALSFARAVHNLASTPAILQQKKQKQQPQQHMLNTNHPTRKQLCYLHNCHTVHSLKSTSARNSCSLISANASSKPTLTPQRTIMQCNTCSASLALRSITGSVQHHWLFTAAADTAREEPPPAVQQTNSTASASSCQADKSSRQRKNQPIETTSYNVYDTHS
jgi:hypothetical protein